LFCFVLFWWVPFQHWTQILTFTCVLEIWGLTSKLFYFFSNKKLMKICIVEKPNAGEMFKLQAFQNVNIKNDFPPFCLNFFYFTTFVDVGTSHLFLYFSSFRKTVKLFVISILLWEKLKKTWIKWTKRKRFVLEFSCSM
jgi:hypothetical protein